MCIDMIVENRQTKLLCSKCHASNVLFAYGQNSRIDCLFCVVIEKKYMNWYMGSDLLLLLCDVDQYCNKKNLILLFKIHTVNCIQYQADSLRHFGPKIGPIIKTYKSAWLECRLVRLDTGPIFGRNVMTSLLGIVYRLLYEFWIITFNSLCNTADQLHTGAKQATWSHASICITIHFGFFSRDLQGPLFVIEFLRYLYVAKDFLCNRNGVKCINFFRNALHSKVSTY